MKATEQFFPGVRSIMLFKVVLIVESEDEIFWCDHSNEASEQYFPVVLFIMLYKGALPLSQWKQSYSVTTQLKLNLSAIINFQYLTSQHFTLQNLLFSLSFEAMRFNVKSLTVMPVFTSHLPHLQLWSCSSPQPWVVSLGFQPADWPEVAKFPVYPSSVIFSSATDSSHPMKWTLTWAQ